MVKAAPPGELLAFALDPRRVSRDKRKRQSPVGVGLQAIKLTPMGGYIQSPNGRQESFSDFSNEGKSNGVVR